MMSIASEIVKISHYADVISAADRDSVSVDQSWSDESTTYTFEDGSKIVDKVGELTVGEG